MAYNGAEGGSNGVTVTSGGAGNSGGLSGTVFDALVISPTCALTFDNTHPGHGALSYKFQLGGTAGECYLAWTTGFTLSDVPRASFKIKGCYFTANPGAVIYLYRVANAAGTNTFGLALDAAGKILIKDGGGTIVATMTSAIPLSTLFDLEVDAVVFGATGTVSVRRSDTAGGNADSLSGTVTAAVPMGRVRWGHTGTGVATVGPWWYDDLETVLPDGVVMPPDTFLDNDLILPEDDGTSPLGSMYQPWPLQVLDVVTGDVNLTPATVNAVTSIDAPAVSAGASLTAVTVAGVATVGAPTVSAGATVSPATVAAIVAVGSPTKSAGASVTPATVAAVATVGAPVVGISYTVTPATVQAVATIGSPTVSAGGSVNITPATVAAVATVGALAISAGATVTPATVAAVATAGVPVPHAGATVAPATVAGVTTVGAPAVSAGATVAPATVAGVATVGVPVVSAGGSVNVSPATVAAVVTVGTPVPHAGASVTPATVAGTVTIGGPVVAVHVTITPATVAVVTTIGAPVVRAGATVIAVTVAGVVTIGAPVVLTTEPPKPGPVVGYRPAVPSATGYRFLAPETVTSPVLTSAAALATTAAAHADRYPAAAPSMVGV
jgi:hypothetical protein